MRFIIETCSRCDKGTGESESLTTAALVLVLLLLLLTEEAFETIIIFLLSDIDSDLD
jgi:hypothetical protein